MRVTDVWQEAERTVITLRNSRGASGCLLVLTIGTLLLITATKSEATGIYLLSLFLVVSVLWLVDYVLMREERITVDRALSTVTLEDRGLLGKRIRVLPLSPTTQVRVRHFVSYLGDHERWYLEIHGDGSTLEVDSSLSDGVMDKLGGALSTAMGLELHLEEDSR